MDELGCELEQLLVEVDTSEALRTADADSKRDLYAAMGVTLTYYSAERLVHARTERQALSVSEERTRPRDNASTCEDATWLRSKLARDLARRSSLDIALREGRELSSRR